MKYYTTTILFIAALLFLSCQSDDRAFSMTPPEGWIKVSDKVALDNLGRYDLSQDEVDDFLKQHGESVPLLCYMKYDPKTREGLIPTIKINIRRNPAQNLNDFISEIQASAESMKTVLPEFHFIHSPELITVGGKDAVYFCAGFSMRTKSGLAIYPRSHTYAVPIGDKFYQINFIDGDEEDCSQLFIQLLKSIQFN